VSAVEAYDRGALGIVQLPHVDDRGELGGDEEDSALSQPQLRLSYSR